MAQQGAKFLMICVASLFSVTLWATAILPVKGRVTSLTKTMAIIKSEKSEFRIDMAKLNEDDRKKIENAQAKRTVVELTLMPDQLVTGEK